MDYKLICKQVCELAQNVGIYIKDERKHFNKNTIEIKGKNDFVTHIDKGSEKRIVEGLLNIFPEAGFITEEKTNTIKKDIYNWIIDPIDGTTNFIHGLSPTSISIALMENNSIVIGVVYELGLNELFYSYKGGKAYLNGNEINISNTLSVDDSLIATGFPYNDFSREDNFNDSMKYFMHNSHGLRRIGSAATDLVYVACGRFDAFYEYSLSPWDVAAGAFIVQQAGGKVSDFKGNDNYIFGREIIATNNNIFHNFQSLINKFFY